MIYSIKDKVIVLTGATGYLGKSITKDLSEAGAKVMVLSTSLTKAQDLCEELNISSSQAFEIDISNEKSVEKTFFKYKRKIWEYRSFNK